MEALKVPENFHSPSPFIFFELLGLVRHSQSKHNWVNKASIHVRDLENEQFIFREHGSSTRLIIENILATHGLKVSVGLALNNTEAVKQAVSAGLGVSIVSEISVLGNS